MEIQLSITGLSHDGCGVGRTQMERSFLYPALCQKKPSASASARAKKASPTPVSSACSQQIPSAAHRRVRLPAFAAAAPHDLWRQLQSELKTQQVRDALQRIGKLDCEVLPVKTMADPFRYRNKGIFHADYTSGQAQLGFYEKNSHDLVPAADCLLFSEQVNRLTAWLEDAITATGLPDIDKVMIRESHATGEMMVVFVTSAQKFRQQRLVENLAENWPQVTSVWHNVNTNPRLMLGRAFNHLAGNATIVERLGDLVYDLSPASFFQVNTAQAEVLYQTGKDMLDALDPSASVLDLYCGIGTIGSFIAGRSQTLHASTASARLSPTPSRPRSATVHRRAFHHRQS